MGHNERAPVALLVSWVTSHNTPGQSYASCIGCQNLCETRQRFCLAHLLGRAVLPWQQERDSGWEYVRKLFRDLGGLVAPLCGLLRGRAGLRGVAETPTLVW